jgi:hypothetical protein
MVGSVSDGGSRKVERWSEELDDLTRFHLSRLPDFRRRENIDRHRRLENSTIV